jgi:hypothetical protein
MPAKFKESAKIMVDRKAKKMKTVHYYLKGTSTKDLVAALENSNTRPKHKQKFRNELTRRGITQ